MDDVRKEPLSRFPAVQTADVDEFRERLAGLFSVRTVDLGRGAQRKFEGRLNHRAGQDISLSYARYGSPLSASISHGDFFVQGFPLRGSGSVVVNGSDGTVQRSQGITGGPGADLSLKYSSDFEHLILTIKPQALTRKLSGLIGRPVDPSLQMMTNVRPAAEASAAQQRLLEFVAEELDRNGALLPPLVLAELEQALMVSYLCNNRHNYSHLLDGPPKAAAPREVRRVEEYIERNWDQPVTIEALALIANASVRSLFYSFKRSRGVSPMTFVRQVRIRRARAMLLSAEPATSVTSVALACGFTNLGHFARYYLAAYGERPSDTLRTRSPSP